MTLDHLPDGASAEVARIDEENPNLVRFAEMGLIAGQQVTMLKRAPLGDPLKVRLMNFELCIRKSDASGIHLKT